MIAYSIEGYGVALKLRTSKTILVEGASDKRVLMRLILQHDMKKGSKSRVVIDEVALASNDAKLSGKGNKEKIEIIATALHDLSSKMNWLVDREWEGADLDSNPYNVLPIQTKKWGNLTKGHSIENYWFRDQLLSDYLKMFYGDYLGVDFFEALSSRFDSIIRLAAAYSFASRRLGTISRSFGLVKADHIEWSNGRYALSQALNTALKARGGDCDIVAEVTRELDKEALQSASIAVLQWLCHGHLGEEIIRACAAHLARLHGCPRDAAEAIERGARADKVAHHADCLAGLSPDNFEPLGDLISWLADGAAAA